MEKEEILHELEGRLKGLPAEDRERLIELYEDLIDVAKENRKANSTLSATLEQSYSLPIAIENDTYRDMGRILLASISLFFFNLIFVLGPVITIFAVYLSLWIVSASFVISPLFVVTQWFIGGFTSFELFLSLIVCGLGIALGIGMIKAGKVLFKIFNKYVKWNIKLIKGE